MICWVFSNILGPSLSGVELCRTFAALNKSHPGKTVSIWSQASAGALNARMREALTT